MDLFCSRHIEWEMSKEERDAYEAEVKRFYADKDRYKLHYNNHTVARGR